MNREIKFRAWEHDRKKMCYGYETYIADAEQNNYPLMQFTGLKDKNGVEIYEGDILCNEEYQTWEWRGVVKFSHGVFGAEWLTNVKSQSMVGSWGQKHNLRGLDDDIIERLIVIGNIFENPDLIIEN